MNKQHNSQSGFSLIELMIAMALSLLLILGISTIFSTAIVIYSAAVPNGRFHWPFLNQTRLPIKDLSRFEPTSSITPDPSEFGTTKLYSGLVTPGLFPALAFASEGFTPEYFNFTTTSPCRGFCNSIS